jgi:alpha-galactosidase
MNILKVIALLLFFSPVCIFSQRAVFKEGEFKKWAITPPMGWNSWDCYGPTVREDEVKANTDYIADHLKEYGWEYVVVDIRWVCRK